MRLSELEFFYKCQNKTIKEAIDYFEGISEYKKSSLENFIKLHFGKIIKNYIQNSSDDEKNKVLNSSFLSFLLGSLSVSSNDVLEQKLAFLNTQYLNLKFPKTIERKKIDYYSNIPYINEQDSLHANILKPQKNYSFPNLDKKSLTMKSWGNTPLILACKTGNSDAAIELLKAHKSLNLPPNDADENEMTPLHWACFFRDEHLIELLISTGADIHSKNNNNQTPYDLYNMEIPYDVYLLNNSSDASICNLPNIPTIAENRISISHNELKSMIDITFHMDKIAFHRLGITQAQLESNLQEPLYRKHQTNSAFEIFAYHYFYDFIQARNKIGTSNEIIKLFNREHTVEKTAPKLELSDIETTKQVHKDLSIACDTKLNANDPSLIATSLSVSTNDDESQNIPAGFLLQVLTHPATTVVAIGLILLGVASGGIGLAGIGIGISIVGAAALVSCGVVTTSAGIGLGISGFFSRQGRSNHPEHETAPSLDEDLTGTSYLASS